MDETLYKFPFQVAHNVQLIYSIIITTEMETDLLVKCPVVSGMYMSGLYHIWNMSSRFLGIYQGQSIRRFDQKLWKFRMNGDERKIR
jgi:hypothetical protein